MKLKFIALISRNRSMDRAAITTKAIQSTHAKAKKQAMLA